MTAATHEYQAGTTCRTREEWCPGRLARNLGRETACVECRKCWWCADPHRCPKAKEGKS